MFSKERLKIGKWEVCEWGICFDDYYDIRSSTFEDGIINKERPWLDHLREKVWFTKECERDFIEARDMCKKLYG